MEINLDNYFTIGEVSRFTGVSIRMLRHYDKIALVKPLYVDPDNQYRYYSEEQVLIISFIKEMRYLNFKFSDIVSFFKIPDLSASKDILKKKLDSIENDLKKIINSKKRLVDFIHQYENIYPFYKNNDTEHPIIQIKELEERCIAFIRKPTLFSVKNFILQFAELQELVVSKQLEIIGPYMAIFHTDYNELKENCEKTDIEFCVSIQTENPLKTYIRKIPESLFLTAVYDDTDNIPMTRKIYAELLEKVKNEGYIITGAMIKQYYYRRQLSGTSHKAISEIQIPVKKP